MKSSLFKNTILTIIALIFVGLTNLVFNILIGRKFDAETLGNINLVISTALLFSLVASTGFGNAATKFIAEHLGKGKTESAKLSFKISLKFTILLSGVLFVLYIVLSDFISTNIGVERKLFLTGTLLIPLYALYIIYKSSYYGVNIIGKYLKNEIFACSLFFITLYVTVFYLERWLILPFIVLYSVFIIISTFDFFDYLKPIKAKQRGLTKSIAMFASISLMGTFANLGRSRLSVVLTGVYVSSQEVGWYAAAFSILTVLYLFPRAMSLVLFPSFSYHYGKEDYSVVSRILNQSTKWLTIITLFFGCTSILLSKLILKTLFGQEYTNATLPLQILIMGACMTIMVSPSVSSLSGTKYVKIPNSAWILGLVSCLIFWPILIPIYSITGTALGFLLSSFIMTVIPAYYAWKHFNLKIDENLRVLVITIAIFLLVVLVHYILPFFSLLSSGILFCIIFIVVFRKIFSEIYIKLMTVIKQR